MNFIKLKMALSQLADGEEIDTFLDDGEPIDKVPFSLEMEGHEIITQEMEEDFWKLTIKKRG